MKGGRLAGTCRAGGVAALLAPGGFASAHDGASSAIRPDTLLAWEPWLTLPLAIAIVLYAVGLGRLWRRAGGGAGVRGWRAACFAAAALALILNFVSPLHGLAGRFFVAHMGEHELLMAIAAPLFALSRPLGAMLWALPQAARQAIGSASGAVLPLWRWLMRPAVATLAHGLAIWVWHLPRLFDAALDSTALHALQHLCFLASALVFWSALLNDRTGRGHGAAVVYLFLTAAHTSLLGAMLVFSRRLWYAPSPGGLAPMDDQQLAGLVMWVPGGLVYAVAALALCGLWIGGRRAGWRPRDAAA